MAFLQSVGSDGCEMSRPDSKKLLRKRLRVAQRTQSKCTGCLTGGGCSSGGTKASARDIRQAAPAAGSAALGSPLSVGVFKEAGPL